MTLERISTGIATLDALIEGGIPKGFTVLLAGNPGTGKTILASHFLYEGLSKGEAAIYVSFSESKKQFYQNFERFGMKFIDFEKDNKFAFLDFASVIKSGIGDALQEVLETSRNIGAKRVVIDSFSAILLAFDDINEARIALHVVLGKMLRAEGITNILIVEVPVGTTTLGSGMEEFVADGIIQLEQGISNVIPSIVKIVKMRATSMSREPHVALIGERGMIVQPKFPLNLIPSKPSRNRVKTGISGLDNRIKGGFLKGSVTALAGAAGAGKTTFGLQFIIHGALEGQIGMFCSLEESVLEVRNIAKSLEYDIDDLEKKGVSLLSWIPENQSPDAFISALASKIVELKPSRIVIDGLSTFTHSYSKEMYLIAKRLVNLMQTYGPTSIFTILSPQESGFNVTSYHMSSIFHNIILLRYVEADAELKRSMVILKMRASSHDQSILQFSIQDKIGLKVMGPMKEYQGILSGIAQKVYDTYVEKEKKIQKKEFKDREKRKSILKLQLDKSIKQEQEARLHRKRKRG